MVTIGTAIMRLARNVENGPSLFNELDMAYKTATYAIEHIEYATGEENGL